MKNEQKQKLADELTFLYSNDDALLELVEILEQHRLEHPQKVLAPKDRLSEQDIVLITYGDQIKNNDTPPLSCLHMFLKKHIKGSITVVHFLPFYPYTSDDGFSVVDYKAIDPALGSWSEVGGFKEDYRLMFDAVINHISISSSWFRGFLDDKKPYKDYFISLPKDTDLNSITRPRTSPLLTAYETSKGTRYVWTSFSSDQADLNYASPQLLLDIVKVLLFYTTKGADIIRLDAITYLWKEIATSGVHHPKTYGVLRLLRTVMEIAAPRTVIISETNVPHKENISYFGDGYNQAQMVYNFALPPLTLYSFLKQDASKLATWAKGLKTPSNETTFFNFLASHDGIGLRPVENIVGDEGIDFLANTALNHGGFVSYKKNGNGSKSPYELNINYFDALNDPNEAQELQVRRFLCAHSIMLSLAGVPGIYFHSLLGSRGAPERVTKTGQNRSINREKFDLDRLEPILSNPHTRQAQIMNSLTKLLKVRKSQKAFHPQAGQEILNSQAELLIIKRFTKNQTIYCLHNVSLKVQEFKLNSGEYIDLPSAGVVDGMIRLEPLAYLWLKEQNS